jgi:hypothetical protein
LVGFDYSRSLPGKCHVRCALGEGVNSHFPIGRGSTSTPRRVDWQWPPPESFLLSCQLVFPSRQHVPSFGFVMPAYYAEPARIRNERDVHRYATTAVAFCRRADRILAKAIRRSLGYGLSSVEVKCFLRASQRSPIEPAFVVGSHGSSCTPSLVELFQTSGQIDRAPKENPCSSEVFASCTSGPSSDGRRATNRRTGDTAACMADRSAGSQEDPAPTPDGVLADLPAEGSLTPL